MHNPRARDMSPEAIQEYILSKCKRLVPSFDPKETIHGFCGARAKSDRGDWIVGPSKVNKKMIHVAGIDSPGLAGGKSTPDWNTKEKRIRNSANILRRLYFLPM